MYIRPVCPDNVDKPLTDRLNTLVTLGKPGIFTLIPCPPIRDGDVQTTFSVWSYGVLRRILLTVGRIPNMDNDGRLFTIM